MQDLENCRQTVCKVDENSIIKTIQNGKIAVLTGK